MNRESTTFDIITFKTWVWLKANAVVGILHHGNPYITGSLNSNDFFLVPQVLPSESGKPEAEGRIADCRQFGYTPPPVTLRYACAHSAPSSNTIFAQRDAGAQHDGQTHGREEEGEVVERDRHREGEGEGERVRRDG
ncbi:hypothetical protein AC578_10560 [Pseudocercospora eumusae]|uniref:Uncharacterized protein n=1 Tax=Pseudocercospora eumusae TaxID=321146 RepID=A0A139H5B3_9PEZI|nr:hypothetical protein AC578_10560 [Pseudocercospora eumusae]